MNKKAKSKSVLKANEIGVVRKLVAVIEIK